MGRQILKGVRRGGGGGDGRRKNGGGNSSSKNKKKNNNKGARWTKGQACVSNPKTTKHREQATSGFLHPVNPGNSLLTMKNLHNNAAPSIADDSDNDTVLSSDVASLTISDGPMTILSTASSVRTIASGWSQVSHNAFERFLRKFGGDIVAHKDMLSILAAASEVIGEAGGKKNETEFFATFVSLLNTCPADQYQAVMALVCIVIGKVSPPVLKLRFADIYPKLGAILSFAIENDDELLIRTSVEAVTKLIKVQDTLNLDEDKELEGLVYSLLKCAMHSKPRVRRKVRISLKGLIISFNEKRGSNVIVKVLMGWILDQLASFPVCDPKQVADTLSLLTACWSCIQKINFNGAKKLFEAILRVMSSGDAAIVKIGLSFFVSVYEGSVLITDDEDNHLPTKLLTALWELQPDSRNIDVFTIWLKCVLLGILQSNSESSISLISKLCEIVAPVWLTHYGKRVVKIFEEYLPHIISPNVNNNIIDSCFQTFAKNYLMIPPNPFVLQMTECLLESLTPEQFTTSAKEVFLQLAPLNQSPGVTSVLGKFVKAFGVENLWMCSDVPTRWGIIMPLLSEHLSNSSILFWKKEMLTQIGRLGTPKNIWLALIGFSRNPKDPDNFPAELVGKVVSEKVELRLSALTALRQFIEWGQCKDMALKYCKNYLPLLFNLYVKEKTGKNNPGHSDAIAVTIQKYVSLCEESFVNQLLEKAFVKIGEAEAEVGPVTDLIAFLGSSVKDSGLQEKVLNFIRTRFNAAEEKKRVYRVMTFLARNDHITPNTLNGIHQMLRDSKGETKSNAAALRLECINILVERNAVCLKSFLSEVILNLLSPNAKAKRCATQYVLKYCTVMKEEGKQLAEVVEATLTALKSSSSLLVSCASYFFFLVYKELKPPSPDLDTLNIFVENLRRFEDAVVWKYSLAFLNLNLSLYKGQMGQMAPVLGAIASDGKYPRKEINKILARMIKSFGSAGLRAVLPNAEDPKMRSRIKNLCRKIRKMKEEKKKDHTMEEESDLEEDEDEFGQMRSDSKPVVIKEGLVDFLSPKEISQALINEKSTKPEELEFSETKDGKLIIGSVEEDEYDSDGDDSSDSEMDIDNVRMARKRKSPGSVASSRKSARTSKTSLSSKSSKIRKANAAGSRSVILPKRRKKLSSKSSVKSSRSASSIVRFK